VRRLTAPPAGYIGGLDRTVGTRANDFTRSEDFATMAALTRRTQSTLD
jgi:hypothetical protein